jgi:hypothetical protein
LEHAPEFGSAKPGVAVSYWPMIQQHTISFAQVNVLIPRLAQRGPIGYAQFFLAKDFRGSNSSNELDGATDQKLPHFTSHLLSRLIQFFLTPKSASLVHERLAVHLKSSKQAECALQNIS